MNKTNKAFLGAAVAGLMSAMSMSAHAVDGKKMKKGSMEGSNELIKCYGVNKCGGTGKCGGKKASGETHACAGQNSCKSQGWLLMPKDSCLALEGGSLEPVEMKGETK
jgi:hypothetical protein